MEVDIRPGVEVEEEVLWCFGLVQTKEASVRTGTKNGQQIIAMPLKRGGVSHVQPHEGPGPRPRPAFPCPGALPVRVDEAEGS